jgi:hypothetical protein
MVLGRTEPLDSFQKQVGDIGAGGLARENTSGQWESGEDVKDDGELEGEQAEERRDLGEIRHGDVVGIASLERPGASLPSQRSGIGTGVSLRILRTVSAASFKPARARV